MARGLDRRQAIGALAGAAMMSAGAGAATGDPVAETRLGKVRGAIQDGVIAFKGIRYAVADRFMPPRQPGRGRASRMRSLSVPSHRRAIRIRRPARRR